MKSNKNKKESAGISEPPPLTAQPRPSSLADVMHADFESFAKAMCPDAFNDADDQKLLRMTWMASARQTIARCSEAAIKPIHATAEAEYNKLATP